MNLHTKSAENFLDLTQTQPNQKPKTISEPNSLGPAENWPKEQKFLISTFYINRGKFSQSDICTQSFLFW